MSWPLCMRTQASDSLFALRSGDLAGPSLCQRGCLRWNELMAHPLCECCLLATWLQQMSHHSHVRRMWWARSSHWNLMGASQGSWMTGAGLSTSPMRRWWLLQVTSLCPRTACAGSWLVRPEQCARCNDGAAVQAMREQPQQLCADGAGSRFVQHPKQCAQPTQHVLGGCCDDTLLGHDRMMPRRDHQTKRPHCHCGAGC